MELRPNYMFPPTQESPFPHMMPTEDYFSKKVSELGISNDHHIITYDSLGVFSSARVYWMFKQFGHKKISILDGGLRFWKIKNKKINLGLLRLDLFRK